MICYLIGLVGVYSPEDLFLATLNAGPTSQRYLIGTVGSSSIGELLHI